MNEHLTERGFVRLDFIDDFNEECSMQESSLAGRACIWLGANEVAGHPARMHLTQEHVKLLLPYLHRFVETGLLEEQSS